MGPISGAVAAVIGVISAVAGVAGGIMQSISHQKQAAAAKEQGEAQARVAEENARQIQVAAQMEKYQQRRRMEHIIGTQRARIGASGVTEEGTPLAILEDTAYQSELENLYTQYKADQGSNKWNVEAANYRAAGRTMGEAYESQAGTSILTGVATGIGRAVGAYDAYRSWGSRGKYPREYA